MGTIRTADGTQIYYKDWGEGQPVVFSHGWPLNADSWDDQMMFLADRDYRVIAHDRRGHGRSDQPWYGNAILEHAFETWGLANARLQREHRVFERDGWRCTFPGCTSYGNLHDHHLEYRSLGGSNDLSNRTTLCVWHHQRGEHAKVVRCRGKAPGRLRFELGLRAGRPPLARYRSGDVLSR